MHRRQFLAAGGLSLAAAPATAGSRAPGSKLGAIVAEHAAKSGFSGTVLVEHRGQVLLHQGFGLADRAHAVPCRRDTRYRVASITKLFTSVMVMRLVEQSRLGLDDTIGARLPAYKGEGRDRVRIRQLLNHTSGIANPDSAIGNFEQAQREGIPAFQLPHSSDQLLDLYASGKLVKEPGAAFDYNNADYILLGKIIERVTGLAYDRALRQMLAPLGMRSTGLLFQKDITPDLASTYFKTPEGALINDLPVYPENWYAAGGACSTTADVLTFARALYGGRLLAPESLRQLLAPGLDDYGFGLWIFDLKVEGVPHRVAQRPGRIMGANAALLRFLNDDLTVVILANTNITDTDELSFKIGRAVLA